MILAFSIDYDRLVGSTFRENSCPDSDVDVLVTFETSVPWTFGIYPG